MAQHVTRPLHFREGGQEITLHLNVQRLEFDSIYGLVFVKASHSQHNKHINLSVDSLCNSSNSNSIYKNKRVVRVSLSALLTLS